MDYAALRYEILSGPHAAACEPFVVNYDAPKTPGAAALDQSIADILNQAPGASVPYPRFMDARALLAELDPMLAATILDKLEAASAANSAVKWAMKYITTTGIDVGHLATRAILDNVLPPEEATAVKALAERVVGYAEQRLGAPVTGADVSIALRGGVAYDPRG